MVTAIDMSSTLAPAAQAVRAPAPPHRRSSRYLLWRSLRQLLLTHLYFHWPFHRRAGPNSLICSEHAADSLCAAAGIVHLWHTSRVCSVHVAEAGSSWDLAAWTITIVVSAALMMESLPRALGQSRQHVHSAACKPGACGGTSASSLSGGARALRAQTLACSAGGALDRRLRAGEAVAAIR